MLLRKVNTLTNHTAGATMTAAAPSIRQIDAVGRGPGKAVPPATIRRRPPQGSCNAETTAFAHCPNLNSLHTAVKRPPP